jgi:hypothetical protein
MALVVPAPNDIKKEKLEPRRKVNCLRVKEALVGELIFSIRFIMSASNPNFKEGVRFRLS